MEVRDIVKNAIDKADPMGLLPLCPPDEYYPEIEDIVSRLWEWQKGISTLEHILHTTFLQYFGDLYCGDRTFWAPVAAEITQGLQGRLDHSD